MLSQRWCQTCCLLQIFVISQVFLPQEVKSFIPFVGYPKHVLIVLVFVFRVAVGFMFKYRETSFAGSMWPGYPLKLLKLLANAVSVRHKAGDVQHRLCYYVPTGHLCANFKIHHLFVARLLCFLRGRGWGNTAWCVSQDEHSRDHITFSSIGYLHACLLVWCWCVCVCVFIIKHKSRWTSAQSLLPFCWPSNFQTTKNKPKKYYVTVQHYWTFQIDLSLLNLTKCAFF